MAQAETMTGGDAIVDQLIANGVDRVFGLPGVQLYPVFDALARNADHVRTYTTRHEQAAAYMAFGFARSTGRPGVYAVVPGPGVLNTTAALCTAMACCAPVLCITGQIPSAFLGRGRGHLHEIRDQLGTLDTLVKWTARIERPADAPEIINEAFRQMLTGRPGPVAVEMAWDTMAEDGHVALLPAATIPPAKPPSPNEIEAAAVLVANARRPIIFTGSGAQHAAAEVRALAETIGAPVVGFRGGRGIIPEDTPLGLSPYAASKLWPDCDLAIGIGSRVETPYMRWTGMMRLVDRPEAPPHLIRIDIDPSEVLRLVPHAPIVADAVDGTRALRDAVMKRQPNRADGKDPDRLATLTAVKSDAHADIQKVQPQIDYLDVLRDVIPRDGLFVSEVSQVGFASYFGYPVYEPRTYITEGYQGNLGFGFPTALGVKAAHPNKPVVSITGDGGFMFAVQELATAAQEQIALIVVLFNNHSFGNVMRDQQMRYDNRVIGSALQNPDFQSLGRSFGIETYQIGSPAELRKTLGSVINTNVPVLIEVDVPQNADTSPWEFILKGMY
ncbi:MAG: thiamine pyrophosphate-dependent enzyme [Pseudomonadota bacterium]